MRSGSTTPCAASARSGRSIGRRRMWIWQLLAAAVASAWSWAALHVPEATLAALAGLIALPFLGVTLLRVVALGEVVASRAGDAGRRPTARAADRQLPVYSVLVPLLREANVLPGPGASAAGVDYPRAKLEILLVLEADDLETQAALLALDLPANFRTILVPDGPRTPSRRPSTTPCISRAASMSWSTTPRTAPSPTSCAVRWRLSRQPTPTGCVQAQLNIYNPHDSWLTRQFTVEYSALFDAILPALARLGLPVPLGGTSNHFPRETLIAVGGWDPFNVTEDADLGFRLARQGWRTTVVASTTWEEAPARSASWFRQRTRWLKGWMQTYLVHTRQPLRLVADLGLRGALGFHALMGGLMLSALAHPAALRAARLSRLRAAARARRDGCGARVLGARLDQPGRRLSRVDSGRLQRASGGAAASLALSALLMPLCWLLVSAAAYRALYQLSDPYRWEKTEHRGEARREVRQECAYRQRALLTSRRLDRRGRQPCKT